jgi:hypothetical protein
MKRSAIRPVGYEIMLPDNGTWMFNEDEPSIPSCPRCGLRLDFFQHNPNYVTSNYYKPLYLRQPVTRQTPIACTYDSQTIVSAEFQGFCTERQFAGLEFLMFDADRGHYQLKVNNFVHVDMLRSLIIYGELCSVCSRHDFVALKPTSRSVIYSAIYDIASALADGVYASDVLFGNRNRRSCSLIVGVSTKAALKDAGFKGITTLPIYGPDDTITYRDMDSGPEKPTVPNAASRQGVTAAKRRFGDLKKDV